MRTLAIDDRLELANEIAKMMKEIDPSGDHSAESNQTAALSMIADTKPDIVWLDVEMPGMSGLAMAAEVKKTSPDTNIVFVTAYPYYALDAMGLHASGYLLKPASKQQLTNEIENLRHPVAKVDNSLLRIQCFGNFEVFHDGKPIRFSRSLGKEALAYLIDRRGAGCTVNEICSVLWEDKQADVNRKSQCRVVLGALRKDLEAVGAGEVINKMWNMWSIDPEKISCDYYDFLRSDSSAVNGFRGEYMAQYSWAEMTIGSLYEMSGNEINLE